MLSFGKYKNESIKEIYQKDKKYLQWLNTQPWFKIKFKTLHEKTTQQLTENEKPITIDPDTIVVYTDGACPNNGSKKARGGIGVHFSLKNKIKMNDVSEEIFTENPTNNKAELLAIERAFHICVENNIQNKIILFTDSNYSIKCITLWYPEWVNKNKLEGKKNTDILQRIHSIFQKLNVELKHIGSQHETKLQDEHSLGNSMADKLATDPFN